MYKSTWQQYSVTLGLLLTLTALVGCGGAQVQTEGKSAVAVKPDVGGEARAEKAPTDMNSAASAFICRVAREKNKKVATVFQFTDASDEETPTSKKVTTIIIAGVSGCGLRIVDNTKLSKVLDEQAKGRTGLYDEETTPEVGKLLGADTLVFGSTDTVSIQVRLVDPTTGEVLGATVQEKKESGGAPAGVQVKQQSPEEAKQQFQKAQLRRWIPRVYKRNPPLFVYVTSTEEELADLKKRHPDRVAQMESRIASMPAERQQKLTSVRNEIRQLRAGDAAMNRKIVSMREEAMTRSRKGGKRGSKKGRR